MNIMMGRKNIYNDSIISIPKEVKFDNLWENVWKNKLE